MSPQLAECIAALPEGHWKPDNPEIDAIREWAEVNYLLRDDTDGHCFCSRRNNGFGGRWGGKRHRRRPDDQCRCRAVDPRIARPTAGPAGADPAGTTDCHRNDYIASRSFGSRFGTRAAARSPAAEAPHGAGMFSPNIDGKIQSEIAGDRTPNGSRGTHDID